MEQEVLNAIERTVYSQPAGYCFTSLVDLLQRADMYNRPDGHGYSEIEVMEITSSAISLLQRKMLIATSPHHTRLIPLIKIGPTLAMSRNGTISIRNSH